MLKIPKTGLNFKQKGHQRGDGKQNQNLPNHGAASYPKEVWGHPLKGTWHRKYGIFSSSWNPVRYR
jgi:hypothetical protein